MAPLDLIILDSPSLIRFLRKVSAIVKWSALCRFPQTKRWENTQAPAVGSPAQIRRRFEGCEGGCPIFSIEELVYLPKPNTRASPRKGAATSSPGPLTPPGRLFGRGKKRSAAAVEADAGSEGPSTPTPKRCRAARATPATDLAPALPPVRDLAAGPVSDAPSTTPAPMPTPMPRTTHAKAAHLKAVPGMLSYTLSLHDR